mgnify:CR=1 FL=1|jgi:hypothetical protein
MASIAVVQASDALSPDREINPDRIRSQMEGSCIIDIGLATTGEISYENGTPQQSARPFGVPPSRCGDNDLEAIGIIDDLVDVQSDFIAQCISIAVGCLDLIESFVGERRFGYQ